MLLLFISICIHLQMKCLAEKNKNSQKKNIHFSNGPLGLFVNRQSTNIYPFELNSFLIFRQQKILPFCFLLLFHPFYSFLSFILSFFLFFIWFPNQILLHSNPLIHFNRTLRCLSIFRFSNILFHILFLFAIHSLSWLFCHLVWFFWYFWRWILCSYLSYQRCEKQPITVVGIVGLNSTEYKCDIAVLKNDEWWMVNDFEWCLQWVIGNRDRL